MAIGPGSRIGAYEVLSLIGAGGMGEVYRARDTRLDREVAIKILPDALAGDRDDRHVLFNSSVNATGLFRKSSDGSGQDEAIYSDDRPKLPLSWSADGRFVILDRFDPGTSNDLWILPIDG